MILDRRSSVWGRSGKWELFGVKEFVVERCRTDVMVARGNGEWLRSRRGRRMRRGGNGAKEGLEHRLVHSYKHRSFFFGKSHHSNHVFDHQVVGDIFIVSDVARSGIRSGCARVHWGDGNIVGKRSR